MTSAPFTEDYINMKHNDQITYLGLELCVAPPAVGISKDEGNILGQ
jgi:hypothetical protein